MTDDHSRLVRVEEQNKYQTEMLTDLKASVKELGDIISNQYKMCDLRHGPVEVELQLLKEEIIGIRAKQKWVLGFLGILLTGSLAGFFQWIWPHLSSHAPMWIGH